MADETENHAEAGSALATQCRNLDWVPPAIAEVVNILEDGLLEFIAEQRENGHKGDARWNNGAQEPL